MRALEFFRASGPLSKSSAAVEIVPDVHSTFATFLLAESAFPPSFSPGPAVFMAKTGVTDLSLLSTTQFPPSLLSRRQQ